MRKPTQSRVMRYHKVSELEDPELHYTTLLQLYVPWGNEEDLKRDYSTNAEKLKFVKDDITRNIEKHDALHGKFDLDDLLNEVLDGVDHDLFDEDEEDNGTSDYGMFNPDLLNLNSDKQGDSSEPSTVPVASRFVENESLPPTVFYEICSLLNEEQQKLFNFIMRCSQELQLSKKNDLPEHNPFHILFSGGASAGKSFLTKLITQYKTSGQDMDEHPAVVVAASTGKTVIIVNGTTLLSAFGLPVREGITFTQLARDKKDNFHKN